MDPGVAQDAQVLDKVYGCYENTVFILLTTTILYTQLKVP